MIPVTNTVALNEHAIQERFVRASGPGGQNVNKVATAVELRFDVRASGLSADVQDRVVAAGGRRVTADGVLVIASRVHRSQAKNREAARTRLIALVRRAATPRKRRRPTRPGAAVREDRIAMKKQRGAVKRARSRVADEGA